jgi:hypothetical protein
MLLPSFTFDRCMEDFLTGVAARAKDLAGASFVKNPDGVAVCVQFVQFAAGYQHRQTLVCQFSHHLIKIRFRTDVQAPARFVQKQEPALVDQPFGENDFLLVTAGKLIDRLVDRRKLRSQIAQGRCRQGNQSPTCDEPPPSQAR